MALKQVRAVAGQESSSFLKKRTKKLLPASVRAGRNRHVNQTIKSFLVLFFKKELLPCFAWLLICAASPVPKVTTPLLTTDTDRPIWRAMHSLLLAIARAADRLVAVGDGGAILLSDDAGASWRLVKSPTDELLASVLFTSPTEGWVVGQDELVLHTHDAGESWTQLHFTKDADQTLASIAPIAPPHLITTGAYDLILETQDGITWQESKIANLDEDYHLNCVAAHGDDVMITGEAGHAFLRHAGGAWAPVKLPYDGSQFACAYGKSGDFFSFGLRGSAYRLPTGSTNWAKIDLGGQQSTFGAATLADGHIVLVGSSGVMRLLDPESLKVQSLPPVTDASLSGVVEVKPGHLAVVGDDGIHLVDTQNLAQGGDAGAAP
jgi:photosystem II stability/assembly factor-like uncharacterized protein